MDGRKETSDEKEKARESVILKSGLRVLRHDDIHRISQSLRNSYLYSFCQGDSYQDRMLNDYFE